jgi:DNA-binding beta-propeller fold protein YncE
LALLVGFGFQAIPPVHAQIILQTIDLGGDGGGIAVDQAAHRAYVAVEGKIKVYDTRTHTLVTTITLTGYTAIYDLALNPGTKRLYATGLDTYVVDTNSNTVVATFADKEGREVAVNTATNRVYFVDEPGYPYTDPAVIHVLNGATNTWLSDINLGAVTYSEMSMWPPTLPPTGCTSRSRQTVP